MGTCGAGPQRSDPATGRCPIPRSSSTPSFGNTGRPQARLAPGLEVDIVEITTQLTSEGYQNLVTEAVDTMRKPQADLKKVVLSLAITASLSRPLLVSDVLRRLRAHEPNCTIFSLPVPDGTFLGASPELLIAKHGAHLSSHPLAGTVARGDTARSDADAQGRLAASAKEHDEHRYVVEDVAAALTPFCQTLTVPAHPSLVTFRSVAHLGTRIEGELTQPTSVLELLARLNPTSAVGGTPRAGGARLHCPR